MNASARFKLHIRSSRALLPNEINLPELLAHKNGGAPPSQHRGNEGSGPVPRSNAAVLMGKYALP